MRTYHLTLIDAQFVDTADVLFPAKASQPLKIVIGDP